MCGSAARRELAVGRSTTVVLIGQCLADDDAVRAAGDDLRRLMSLPGAFSAVVQGEQGTTLVSDASAQFPLYLSTAGERAVFGPCATAVAEQIGAQPDLVHLAARITAPQLPELLVGRTAFGDVRQLEPGTAFRIGTGYLDPAIPLTAQENASFDRCAEELRECLRTAVSARISPETTLSSDFSGGLDSTSLAFLAVPEVDVLSLVTYAQEGAPVDDDLRHAEFCGRLDPRFRHHVVRATGEHLPYQDWPVAADLPHPSGLAMGPTAARISAVAAEGATHLVGEGGDLVLGAPLGYFVDLARRGDLGTLWRHCAGWARLRHRSPLSLFRRSVRLAAISRRQGLLSFARELERHRAVPTPVAWEDRSITAWGSPACDWLAPPARAALAGHLRELADEDSRMDACDRAMLVRLDYVGATQRAVRDTGARHGVDVHAPFLDSEVVRICLSLPAWRRCDPSSSKPLLRKALEGLVPQVVLRRRTKGDYTATAHMGIRRNLRALRELMADPVSAEIGLIEPRRVVRALDRAAHGLETSWAPLNQVLAIELWLLGLTRGVSHA